MVGLMITRALVTAVALVAAAPALADAAAGQKAFAVCSTCHAVTAGRNGIGPSLYGIVGRPAAALAGYKYSAAMTKSGLIWTPDTLHTYLAAPGKTVPGTKMTFGGIKDAAKLTDVVAYLETLK